MSGEVANIASEGTSIIRMIIEPRQIRKITDATCDSLEKLKEKVDGYEEPTYTSANGIFVCNKAYSQMLNSYGCPFGPLGAKQLENITNVLNKSEIKANPESLGSADVDWLMKAIDEIRFVSDDTLAFAWNKLLKGKIENGNRYSKRTIDLLANLSKEDALLFEKYAKRIISIDSEKLLFAFNLKGQELMDIKQLDYAGFIDSKEVSIKNGCYIWKNYYLITAGVLQACTVTQFGLDIFGIFELSMELDDYAKELEILTKNKVKWSLHECVGKDQRMLIPTLKNE